MTGLSRQITLATATIVMIVINLAQGSDEFTREGSEEEIYWAYQTLFTPAPFTFFVWTPIFLGCLALAVYQALPNQRNNPRLDAIGITYLLALIANTVQVYTGIGWTLIAVSAILVALSITFVRYYRAWKRDPGARTTAEYWCVRVPLGLFTTWILVATLLNVYQTLASVGITAGAFWAAAGIVLAMMVGILTIRRTSNYAILAIMLWAAAGIATQQSSVPVVFWVAIGTAVISLVVNLAHEVPRRFTRFSHDS